MINAGTSMYYEVMGIIAGIFAFADIALYILAILGRDYRFRRTQRTVPNRATWFIWAAVGIILVASYRASGAVDTIWFAAAYALGFVIIAILSIKHGEGGFDFIDIVCVSGAIASAWAWWEYSSPEVALFGTIAMDAFGSIPTIEKSWRKPWTENITAWLLSFIASCANVLAINWDTANFAVVAYPVYMLLIIGLITILLFRHPKQLFKRFHHSHH